MRAKRKVNNHKDLKEFGDHLQSLIRARGYKSPYDFWVQIAGDDISRASLNYLVKGEREPRLSTLLLLMDLLDVTPQELFRFGDRKKK